MYIDDYNLSTLKLFEKTLSIVPVFSPAFWSNCVVFFNYFVTHNSNSTDVLEGCKIYWISVFDNYRYVLHHGFIPNL